ncbi:MAG: hypothetical protein AB8F94_27075 [Saprospiraceae bacterium]
MKPSNILSTTLFFTLIFGMYYTNIILKKEYLKIDLSDKFKNYISYNTETYSVINIEGSNGYPIEIKNGKSNDVKVLRSRKNHFKKTHVKDTLFIEFTGANISNDQSFSNETPTGIIIETNTLSKIIVSNTYNRMEGFSGQAMEIILKNSSIAEIADCKLKSLNLSSRDHSQYVFSKNNIIDSLNLIMLDKSIGRLEQLDYKTLNHSLGDSVTMVLSKNIFAKISS